jgi:hypothetical protein
MMTYIYKLKMKVLHTYLIGTIIILSVLPVGCKKFVEIPSPATSLVSSNVYNNNTAPAVMNGIYERMMQSATNFSSGTVSISVLAGLSSDELTNYSTTLNLIQAYKNEVNENNVPFWTEMYQYIYTSNAVIAGLNSPASTVTAALKQQLIGEAEFIRAFCHFYLTNIFGDVPLIVTTDYQTNSVAIRVPQSQVYSQVIADLKDAEIKLNSNFVGPDGLTVSTERTRPNKWAAAALLARAYLYTKDYTDAIAQATLVINNNTANIKLEPNLNNVFLKNSNEAIWQLQPVVPGYDAFDGNIFILTTPPGGSSPSPVALSTNLTNSFENGDNRFANWVGSYPSNGLTYYYPYKYKVKGGPSNTPLTEYLMVLRIAEQYLIRAEAEANGSSGGQGAVADLNTIRNRAGLPNYTGATDQASLLTVILHERQVELFTEWGHRWFDLKRTNIVNTIMPPSPGGNVCAEKGGTWNSDWELYPIPLTEIEKDSKLIQNPGY